MSSLPLIILLLGVALTSSLEDCTELPDAGLCRGYIERYYWNPEAGSCQEFIYGGCGGNGNKFETVEECEKACRPSPGTSIESAPPEPAPVLLEE